MVKINTSYEAMHGGSTVMVAGIRIPVTQPLCIAIAMDMVYLMREEITIFTILLK